MYNNFAFTFGDRHFLERSKDFLKLVAEGRSQIQDTTRADIFLRLYEEHRELYDKLVEKITPIRELYDHKIFMERAGEFEPLLYEAYKILRTYVDEDSQIFA